MKPSNESYSCGQPLHPDMLYKVVLTFNSVDETLVCDHSNKSYGKFPS